MSSLQKAHELFAGFGRGNFKPITRIAMSKLMHLLIMYHQIHRLHRAGFSVAWISREVVLNRRTVKKYLAMSEEEFIDYKHKHLNRKKLLDPYEDYVRNRLEGCPEASAAQVQDWLKEHFEDLAQVNEDLPTRTSFVNLSTIKTTIKWYISIIATKTEFYLINENNKLFLKSNYSLNINY